MADAARVEALRRLKAIQDAKQGNRLSAVEEVDRVLSKIPGVPQLTEIAAGANRSILDTVDFASGALNEILKIAGSDRRIPSARRAASQVGIAPERGAFVGEGRQADALAAAGEVIPAAIGAGGLLRKAGEKLSPLTAHSENAIRGLVRQITTSGSRTAPGMIAQDVVLGGLSGAGGEIGQQLGGAEGAVIGSLFTPLAAQAAGSVAVRGAQAGITTTKNFLREVTGNPQQLSNLQLQLAKLSDDGASQMLAEMMRREGVSPDELADNLAVLGKDGIPADTGDAFRRLLKQAGNRIPRIEGLSNQILNQRAAGTAQRLESLGDIFFSSLDDAGRASGLSADDQIAALDARLKPQVAELYDKAADTGLALPQGLRTLFESDSSLGRAFQNAQGRLNDMRVALISEGKEPKLGHFHLIDATKRELDDMIGQALSTGRKSEARDLIRMKKGMVAVADETIPEYAQARELWSGKMAMEDAAEMGKNFFSIDQGDLKIFASTLNADEIKMLRLGAKEAILDKALNMKIGDNGIEKMFGTGGEINKLKVLFPDSLDDFNRFKSALERESLFSMTRNTTRASAVEAAQVPVVDALPDTGYGIRAVMGNEFAQAKLMKDITAALERRSDKGRQLQAMSSAAEILVEAGVTPDRFRSILADGDAKRMKDIFQRLVVDKWDTVGPVVRAGIANRSISSNEEEE